MARVVILGAGMMGSALAVPLVDRGHDVRLVGTHLDEDIVAHLKRDRAHPKLKLGLPREITPFAVAELAEAAKDADAIALGVSSAGLAWATERIAPLVRPSWSSSPASAPPSSPSASPRSCDPSSRCS